MSTITIDVDLAKHLFSGREMVGAGHVLRQQELRRDAVAGGWPSWRPVRWRR